MVGSHRLHARRFGSPTAPLVLCAHGLTGSADQFDVLGERLGNEELQAVAVDLRGRGASAPTGPGTYGWDNHALDLVAVAGALGFERFAIVGLSMGASVGMKVAEIDGSRLSALVLIDVAGRVDPGVGQVVAAAIADVTDAPGSADPAAVAEDRAYTLTHDPYERWKHLTMPTLLLRATEELVPGAGYVVPSDDRDRFKREVPEAVVVEIEASHLSICSHPDAADATSDFLRAVLHR